MLFYLLEPRRFLFAQLLQSPSSNLSSGSFANADLAITLPEVTVSSTTLLPGSSIVPTSRNISSYGPEMNIMDIPRDVRSITKEEMQTVMAMTVNDLSAFSPSVNPTQATGNILSEPVIRGLPGTVFRNGMLVGFSSGGNWGPLMNMMAYDSLDIVTGPVGVVFGPQEFAGGYLNELTKQPYFDRFHGNAFVTYGMYGDNFWNADIGGPIDKEKKTAFRFDYFGQAGYAPFNYYDGAYMQREAFYMALCSHPYENVIISWNGELDFNNFVPYAGINRPTNSLIDNGLYQTGPWIGSIGINGHFIPGHPTSPPGGGYVVDFGSLVPVSGRNNIFNSPLNFTLQTYGVFQPIVTLKLGENTRLVNNFLFEYFRTEIGQPVPMDTWGFLPYGFNFADRLELIVSKEHGHGRFNQLIDSGIEFRYVNDLEYFGTWHGPANQVDMTRPFSAGQANPPVVSYSQALAFGNPFLTDIPIPGLPGGFFNIDNFLSTQCSFSEYSPFFQDVLSVGDNVSLLFGARMDIYNVLAMPPDGTPTLLQQPFVPYGPTQITAVLPQLTLSPTYKPFPWLSLYATGFWGQTTAQSQFGAFAPEFTSSYYHQQNELEEMGAKFNFFEGKMFLSISFYNQSGFVPAFVLPNGLTPTVSATVRGLQLQGAVQPRRNLWITFGYNHIEGFENWNSDPTGPTVNQPYSTRVAALYHLPVDPIESISAGIYPFIGFPSNYANLMLTYKMNNGFGISLWTIGETGQWLGFNYALRTPSWYTLNGRLFYATSRWEAGLWLYNLTNIHYWLAGAPGFTPAASLDYDYAALQMPFWIQASFQLNF
ncbi:hypothetical protein A7Q10_09455 [Methylacidiphilum caldifontis]|uniref:TonB-dependent receptor plug domain-containing protein n=1 Tax=Methylacidiphilum caldifontis TaxID=2795386 RepID=A0A4Y8P9X1_9BACT|nr:hypothetical protein A7Q10_09455 [Methylacidiphilum caldifontis]